MAHSTRLNAFEDIGFGLEVLMGQLETMIPERILSRAPFLGFLPVIDAIFFARSTFDIFVGDGTLARQVWIALCCIGNYHLVAVGAVLEKVINTFFFHQPADEIEIGLAVLDAKVARMKCALDLVRDSQAGQHLLKNVGNGHLLKNPALRFLCELPELGNNFHTVVSKDFVSLALA